jgi:hypothetical protein
MRKVFCAFIVLCFVTIGNAQLLRHYGLKVAYTSATQSFDYYTAGFGFSNERRPGINAAVFAEWLNMPFLSVITQVEYSQRGLGIEFARTLNDPTVIGTWVEYHRVDYLSVPLLAKVSFPSTIIEPYLVAGPRIDFVLGYHGNDENFRSLYNDFKSPNLGGTVGAGVSVSSILPAAILLEFRYNIDLTLPYDNGLLRVKNSAYDIWLGVAI